MVEARELLVCVNGAERSLIWCISRAQVESGERKRALLSPDGDRCARLTLTDVSQAYSKLSATVWRVSCDGVADDGCLHATYINKFEIKN